MIVRNVLYASKVCLSQSECIENWAVKVTDHGYIINVYFVEGVEVTVPIADLLTIKDVNHLRVSTVAVVRPSKNPASIMVFVLNKDQPITLTETEVVRIRKRTRILNLF